MLETLVSTQLHNTGRGAIRHFHAELTYGIFTSLILKYNLYCYSEQMLFIVTCCYFYLRTSSPADANTRTLTHRGY